jgi:hypothetical protein
VIRERGKEGLVDRGIFELLGQGVVPKHVDDRVRLPLDPELVAKLGVPGDVEDPGLASRSNDIVVVGRGDRPGGATLFAREKALFHPRQPTAAQARPRGAENEATYHPMA